MSSEVAPQGERSRSAFVRIIANCELGQEALQPLLYGIEAGMPFLFIDQFRRKGRWPRLKEDECTFCSVSRDCGCRQNDAFPGKLVWAYMRTDAGGTGNRLRCDSRCDLAGTRWKSASHTPQCNRACHRSHSRRRRKTESAAASVQRFHQPFMGYSGSVLSALPGPADFFTVTPRIGAG